MEFSDMLARYEALATDPSAQRTRKNEIRLLLMGLMRAIEEDGMYDALPDVIAVLIDHVNTGVATIEEVIIAEVQVTGIQYPASDIRRALDRLNEDHWVQRFDVHNGTKWMLQSHACVPEDDVQLNINRQDYRAGQCVECGRPWFAEGGGGKWQEMPPDHIDPVLRPTS